MSAELDGAIALVTGASRGIGEAIAHTLYDRGSTVYLLGRNRETLEAAAGRIAHSTPGPQERLRPLEVDLSRGEEIDRLLTSFPEQRLDVLVNNAGVAVNRLLEETTDDQWSLHFRVNVEAPFRLIRGFLPKLVAADRPAVVNIGSVVSTRGYPGQGAYSASKHALLGLTKVFARELHDRGVRVFSVEPGGVATDMVRSMRPDIDESALVKPEAIGETVAYLLSLHESAMVDQVQIRRSAKEPWS